MTWLHLLSVVFRGLLAKYENNCNWPLLLTADAGNEDLRQFIARCVSCLCVVCVITRANYDLSARRGSCEGIKPSHMKMLLTTAI